MTLDWSCQHHDALTKEALYAILALRTQVFVVEQKCPYLEVDGLEATEGEWARFWGF